MAALLETVGLTRTFGGVTAVDRLDLAVAEGELVSIIGPNGAGKSTLFDVLSGLLPADAGAVAFGGQTITGLPAERVAALGIARTFQHGRVFANLSVLDNVLVGAHTRLYAVRPHSGLLGGLLGAIGELGLALLQPATVAAEEKALHDAARDVLSLFGDRLLKRADDKAFTLSYANRRRLELARALALRPRLLLLDEPTAGMNPTESAEMLAIIHSLKDGARAILLIEHKLDLVMQLSDRVVVMDEGRKIAEGPPAAVAAEPRVLEAYLGHAEVGAEVASPGGGGAQAGGEVAR
jgi:branched-chain amino acid transport system ATP-binding protein